jgi:hypothetical protein
MFLDNNCELKATTNRVFQKSEIPQEFYIAAIITGLAIQAEDRLVEK